MANIPVEERRGGAPWWLWLMLLLLLAGGIFFIAEALDSEPDGDEFVYDDTETVDGLTDSERAVGAYDAENDTATLTSLNPIVEADNAESMVGRRVDVNNVRVASLAGDSTFWAYPNGPDGERVFVVLEELGETEHGPGTGADGRYNVDDADLFDITGTVQQVRPNDPDAWGVTGEEAAEMREQQVYIRADRLDIRS